MNKDEVLKHFGGVGAVAQALGVKSAAVSQWGEIVPARRAYEIERITDGALKVDVAVYDADRKSA